MAFDAFLKLDGIVGGTLDDKHKGEIDVLAFSWDVRAGPSGAPRLSELVVVKNVDQSTPALFQHACKRQPIGMGRLTVRTAGEVQVETLRIDLTGVFVSRLEPFGSASGTFLREQLGLRFTDVTITVTKIDPRTGLAGGQVMTTC